MFRMMKLHQNVKGKILSFTVSFSVLALTIVGAFAVSFKKANATYSQISYTWSNLEDLVLDFYPNHEDIESWFAYFGNSETVANPIGVDIFNAPNYLVLAALGNEPSQIAITVWKYGLSGGPTHSDGWYISNDRIRLNSTSGYVYQRVGLFYSDLDGYIVNRQGVYYTDYQIDVLQQFSFGQTTAGSQYINYTIMPNSYNIYNANYSYLTSQNIYGDNSSVITYAANLFGAPVSAYNNVCFAIGQQYYFTFSDQSILLDFVSEQSSNVVPVTFQKNGQAYVFNYSMDELVYTGRSSLSGVSNIGPGGVIAWNITPLINQWYFDSIIASHVDPSEVYRNYFAYNEAIISWVPYQDPAAQYEYYLEQFQNIVGHSYVANPNELPSYIISGNVGFSQDINAHVIMTGSSAGKVYFDSVAGQHAYDPDVLPNSILVISSAMFDTDFSDELTQEDQDVFDFFTGLLTPDVDLIVVLDHSKWTTLSINVTQGQGASIMSAQDAEYFKHNSYYQDWSKAPAFIKFYFTKGIEESFIVNEGVNSYSGMVFATQRYYTRITNAILAEGFNALQTALDKMTTNQNTFFTGAINSIGAAIYAIDTVAGKLDSIYKYLRYDVDLSDKLTKIVDKLEKIADNTDEQTHDYWFISLYNWLLQFAPSNSDFATWVSDLTSFENQLPDPEATPAATIIPFPTVTSSLG